MMDDPNQFSPPPIYLVPKPPSVNDYYANNKRGKGRGRYVTERGRTWRRAALNDVQKQGVRLFKGPAIVTICAPESNRRADIDNLIKPTLDLLVTAGVLEDDCAPYVREVRARWVAGHLPFRVALGDA